MSDCNWKKKAKKKHRVKVFAREVERGWSRHLIIGYCDEDIPFNLQQYCSLTTGEIEVSKCMAWWL